MSIGKLLMTVLWLFAIQMNSQAFIWVALIVQVMVIIPMAKRLNLGIDYSREIS